MFAAVWRGALRGTLACALPLLSPPSAGVRLLPLVEIHNDPGSGAPLLSDNFRAGLGLEALAGWQFFALAHAGNDESIGRTGSVRQIGLGIRWSR